MSIAVPPFKKPKPYAVLPAQPVRRFTVDEYHGMIDAGILTEDDHVELLKGLIVPKMPHTPHKQALPLTQMALSRCLPQGWYLGIQQPVAAPESEPEPDVTAVRGTPRDYPDGTPGAAHVGLLIEVSDSSLKHDRDDKGPVYAEASFPIYRIINLIDRIVEVYADPTGPCPQPQYRQRRDYAEHEEVPLVLDGVEVARIPVRDLLP